VSEAGDPAVTTPAAPSTASTPATVASGTPHEVSTHCGVMSTIFEGDLWIAEPPLGDHNPPPGWDENRQQGTLTPAGPDKMRFDGGEGRVATFRRAAEGEPDPNEGCE
jgi:hypothetical protein